VLYGQSAGANGVITYSYAHPEDPIVSAVIASSGGGAADGSVGTNTTAFSTMAKDLGCGGLGAAEELACMQKVNATKIHDYVESHYPRGPPPGPGSDPSKMPPRLGSMVADNVTAFVNNTDRLHKGLVAKVVSEVPTP